MNTRTVFRSSREIVGKNEASDLNGDTLNFQERGPLYKVRLIRIYAMKMTKTIDNSEEKKFISDLETNEKWLARCPRWIRDAITLRLGVLPKENQRKNKRNSGEEDKTSH